MKGHGLRDEGAPYEKIGTGDMVRRFMGTGGEGRGVCSCGEASPWLTSGKARRRWHDDHKQTVYRRNLMSTLSDKTRQDIRDTLVEHRKKMGWTQRDLAAALGVSQPSVARVESGNHNLKIATVVAYAHAVGLVLELRPDPDVLDPDEEPAPES